MHPDFTGRPAAVVRRTVTVVVFTIAGLAFAFGFGNGWALGLRLGVPVWIAPLVAPAVDLSVVALLVAVQYLTAHGVPRRELRGARLLLVTCGLATLALNTAAPVLAGDYGRACFDSAAPLLLIGWSEVGPRLLALLHTATPAAQPAAVDTEPAAVPAVADRPVPMPVPDRPEPRPTQPTAEPPAERPGPPAGLLDIARRIADEHHAATGEAITRDALRARLRVSNALAGELLHHVRTQPATA
jgi:hypothetical protein